MSYTMEDFKRDLAKDGFKELTPREQKEVLRTLPPERQQELLESLPAEKRLAGLSAEQVRQYLDQLTSSRSSAPRKPRRKK